MRTIRAASGYAALWLLVVAVGSSFAWTAIRQAGTQTALVAGGPIRVQAPVDGVLPTSSGAATATVPSTTTAPQPTLTPPLAPAPTNGGHASGIPTASGPGRSTPGSSATAPRPGTAPAPPLAPAPPTIEGSLVTRGGTVAVACTGSRLIFRSARPQDGWRLDGPSTESGSLRVSFEAGGDGGDEVHVSATCVGGQPQLLERPDEDGD